LTAQNTKLTKPYETSTMMLDKDQIWNYLQRGWRPITTIIMTVRPGQICTGATQAVVGWLMGGSGPKSVSGSS
jgi:hypothetical protein